MTAYNEVEYDLHKWPTTTATSTLARVAEAHSSAAGAGGCSRPVTNERGITAPPSGPGNRGIGLNGRLSGSVTKANAWGFV